MQTTFKFKGVTFVVKLNQQNIPVYRDQAHLGGPWSDVVSSTRNPSLDSKFRKLLSNASVELIDQKLSK